MNARECFSCMQLVNDAHVHRRTYTQTNMHPQKQKHAHNRSMHTLKNTFTYYTYAGHRNVFTTILFTDDGCFMSTRHMLSFLMTETSNTITISSRAVSHKIMRARLQYTQSHVNNTSESFLNFYTNQRSQN